MLLGIEFLNGQRHGMKSQTEKVEGMVSKEGNVTKEFIDMFKGLGKNSTTLAFEDDLFEQNIEN